MLVPPFQFEDAAKPTDCTTLTFCTISNGERRRKVEPTLPEVVLRSWKEVS